MKRHWIAGFMALFTLALLAGTVVAKEAKGRPDKPDGRRRARQRRGGPGQMPGVGLTDAQKKEIGEIRKTAMAKIKDAEPKDRRAIFAKMRKDIGAVLTEEQREKMKKARQGERRGRGMPDIGLTDEQKAKMDAIRKEARAKLKDAKGEDRKAILEKMKKDIEALLTDEQLEKFKKFRRNRRQDGGRPDIGLTDEQKTKIDAIRKEARAAAKDAKGEDRKAVFQKMRKDIEALLTEEQLEKFKKARKDGPPRGKGKGRRGQGGDRPRRKRPANEE